MLLNINEATKIVNKELSGGKIQAVVSYKDLYLFQIFTDDPGEEEWDPFYSININTGEFSEFSIITDGNLGEITKLFEAVKGKPTK